MNTNALAAVELLHPQVNVELLSEEELRSIEGGAMWAPALGLVLGSAGMLILGVAVGVAVYYFTR